MIDTLDIASPYEAPTNLAGVVQLEFSATSFRWFMQNFVCSPVQITGVLTLNVYSL